MLVDKADIRKAKEKLGDENFTILCEELNLDGVDTQNMKALCPYHHEKTPSFIYNKKDYNMTCFGCNKTVDIIDVKVEQGMTYLEACKFLFDKAGISYSFGEKDVKTKRQYKYPHEEPLNDRQQVIDYLGRRGISKATIDYLDIRQDSHGNCVFNFYDLNDVLTMVKYRPARTINKHNEPKTWCQKDADTAPLLFNMNRINTEKPLLITEGEVDAASCIESGYINTVSVPLGAGNTHWIEENWDWLDQFESIIIWSDNDEPGEKLRADATYRLGAWRTKYVVAPPFIKNKSGKNIPVKDANECLQIRGKDFVMQLIQDAKDIPVSSVVDYADVEDEDISDMKGIESGLKPLDDELIKVFYGTLTILSGRPSSGKTSLVDQIIGNAADSGESTFLYSKEMPEKMSANWFNSIIAGRRNMVKKQADDGRDYYVVPYAAKQKMRDYYRGKIVMYKDSEPNDVDSIIKSAEECVRKYGCKIVVLDNLMMIDLKCTDDNMNSSQTNLINRLIQFAGKFNVAVILIAHPKKTQDSMSDIEMYDIAGSSNIINLAQRSIGLRRVSKKEKEDCGSKWHNYDVVLTVIKDRLLGKTGVQMGLWYDIVSRRFYTNYEEYDKQFAWDDKKYAEKLPYANRAEEVFPDGRAG